MKSSTTGGTTVIPNPNRRQPTRSVRTTAARPSNYYARHFGFRGSTGAAVDNEITATTTPGFCPAITHFTDAIAALPKEVMRHFTLLKETEGKAYQPDHVLGELVSAIKSMPRPPRQQSQRHTQAFLGMSLANSVNGSVPGSVIDSYTPSHQHAPSEFADNTSQAQPIDQQEDARHSLFLQLQLKLREMTMILDEKNMVLSTANETLARQLARLDGTMPYIENEISEEARLGSNTHWALPHMKELRRVNAGPPNERTRRDVQAANNLAAAVAAVQERDLVAMRSEARREAVAAKRRNHNIDSDFDDRPMPKKSHIGNKTRKMQDIPSMAETKGLQSAPAGPPHKRRRIEKEKAAAPHGERSIGAALGGRSGARAGIPREAPVAEEPRKRNKPLPVQAVARKKNVVNSPSLVQTPTRGIFATTTNKVDSPTPSMSRIPSARGRQNSTNSTLQDASRNRPSSAGSNNKSINGARATTPDQRTVSSATGRTMAEAGPAVEEGYELVDDPKQVIMEENNLVEEVMASVLANDVISLKREETEPAEEFDQDSTQVDNGDPPNIPIPSLPPTTTRSRTGSKPSKPATPIIGLLDSLDPPAAVPLVRSRSVRSTLNNISTLASSPPLPPVPTPSSPRRSHKKGAAAAAASARDPVPYTTDPRSRSLSFSSSMSLDDLIQAHARKWRQRHPAAARPRNGRSNHSNHSNGNGNGNDAERQHHHHHRTASDADGGGGGGGGAPSEADPNEPKYCVCDGVSYGEMVACDNEACPREWFHLDCVGLSRAPTGKAKWFCEECKEAMRGRAGAKNGGAGGGVVVGNGWGAK